MSTTDKMFNTIIVVPQTPSFSMVTQIPDAELVFEQMVQNGMGSFILRFYNLSEELEHPGNGRNVFSLFHPKSLTDSSKAAENNLSTIYGFSPFKDFPAETVLVLPSGAGHILPFVLKTVNANDCMTDELCHFIVKHYLSNIQPNRTKKDKPMSQPKTFNGLVFTTAVTGQKLNLPGVVGHVTMPEGKGLILLNHDINDPFSDLFGNDTLLRVVKPEADVSKFCYKEKGFLLSQDIFLVDFKTFPIRDTSFTEFDVDSFLNMYEIHAAIGESVMKNETKGEAIPKTFNKVIVTKDVNSYRNAVTTGMAIINLYEDQGLILLDQPKDTYLQYLGQDDIVLNIVNAIGPDAVMWHAANSILLNGNMFVMHALARMPIGVQDQTKPADFETGVFATKSSLHSTIFYAANPTGFGGFPTNGFGNQVYNPTPMHMFSSIPQSDFSQKRCGCRRPCQCYIYPNTIAQPQYWNNSVQTQQTAILEAENMRLRQQLSSALDELIRLKQQVLQMTNDKTSN